MINRVDNYPEEVYKASLEFVDFVPGSIVAIRVSLAPVAQAAVQRLRSLISSLPAVPDDLQQAMNSMTLADMNLSLYRCDREEVEDKRPGCYVIPGYGPMIYCGLQGVVSLLSDIRPP